MHKKFALPRPCPPEKRVIFYIERETLDLIPHEHRRRALRDIIQAWITLNPGKIPKPIRAWPRRPGGEALDLDFFPEAWRVVFPDKRSQRLRSILRSWCAGQFPVFFSHRVLSPRGKDRSLLRGIFLGLDDISSLPYYIIQRFTNVEQILQGVPFMTDVIGTPLQIAEMEAAKLTLGDLAHPPIPGKAEEPAAEEGGAKKTGRGRPRGTTKAAKTEKTKEEKMSELTAQAQAAGAPAQGLAVGLQPGIVNENQVTGGFSFGAAAPVATPPAAAQGQSFEAGAGLQPSPGVAVDFSEVRKLIAELAQEVKVNFKDSAEQAAERFLDLGAKIEQQCAILNQRVTQHGEVIQEMLAYLKSFQGSAPQQQQSTPAATPPATQQQTPPATTPAQNGAAPQTPPAAGPVRLPDQLINPNFRDFFEKEWWLGLLQEGVWPAGPAPLKAVAEQLVAQIKAAYKKDLTVDQVGESFMARGFADMQNLTTIPLADLKYRNAIL